MATRLERKSIKERIERLEARVKVGVPRQCLLGSKAELARQKAELRQTGYTGDILEIELVGVKPSDKTCQTFTAS